MNKKIEFYFDVCSPTAYIARKTLKNIAKEFDAEMVYEPMCLHGLYSASNNVAPAVVPAKGL